MPCPPQFSGIEESEARTLLAHFGLDTDAIRRPLERLSPGQRARAAIAALVASQADLLLLDEPTNHLDFDTLEVLETALAESPSTIVAVSHDRWFLDAIGVTRRLHVAGGMAPRPSQPEKPRYAGPPWPPAWLREGPVSWGLISAMSSSDAGTE